MKWSWPPPLAVSGRGAKIASKGPSLTGTREGKGRMPKRQAARDRAQATVNAAAARPQPAPTTTGADQSLLVRVSPERWQALKVIAQGRSLDAVVADLSSWGRQWTPPFGGVKGRREPPSALSVCADAARPG